MPKWVVHDLYCGIGGYTCSVIEYLKSTQFSPENIEFHGWEMDARVLDVWAQNVRNAGFVAVSHHEEICHDTVFPPETDTTIMHFSPPCQAHSRARTMSKATSPSTEESSSAASTLRFILQTIVDKGYRRFSVENVYSQSVKRSIEEFASLHPKTFRLHHFDAATFGCPSSRMRYFLAPPAVIQALVHHPTSSVSVAEALARHGLVPPESATHISNANVECTQPRPITGQSYTVLASHPLTWKKAAKVGPGFETVRGLSVQESSIIMSFPSKWQTSTGKALGLRGVGNAIAPAFGQVIAKYLIELEYAVAEAGLCDESTAIKEPQQLIGLIRQLECRVMKLEKRLKKKRKHKEE
jgi:site-specific DNA-cytosine methylase